MSDIVFWDEEIDEERLARWYQTVKDRPASDKITIIHLGPIDWSPYIDMESKE